MNREYIIKLAREAGMVLVDDKYSMLPYLERFAAIVTEHEREQCAKVCDEAGVEPTSMYPSSQAKQLADAIRARE